MTPLRAMFPLLAALATPPSEPPSIFARATADSPLDHRTYLVPGATYVGWQPLRSDGATGNQSGGGLELSVVRWLSGDAYVGVLGQVERVGRFRAAMGVEAGYQLIGFELSLAREFAERDGSRAQWSLQLAPYASLGMVFISPRFLIALDRRGSRETPGDGAMLVVGLKAPILLGGH